MNEWIHKFNQVAFLYKLIHLIFEPAIYS